MPGARIEACARMALAGVALLAMAACLDGYPQRQEPILSPYDMSQDQRLAQMNALGAQMPQRWAYALMPGCVLRVDIDGPQGASPSRDIPLLGQVVAVSGNRDQSGFQVALQRSDRRDAQAALVLESEKWTDASWTQLLLRLLQKGCMDMAQHLPR